MVQRSRCYLLATASFVAVNVFMAASPALAQSAAGAPAVEEIIVTGFRSSLAKSLVEKRAETAAVDSIVAEDIGKFPDANLAESMQRISGVSLSRGDGGEGRGITVRGLSAEFTRVRINGMEASSQTGASDIYGLTNNTSRSFDFNVFPTEIFNSLAVRKTPSADVEEGSLGATVDLSAPHPLDFSQDFVLTATARAIYNTVSSSKDPRFSLLVSKKFADGKFGLLGSVSFTHRRTDEVGWSASRNLPAWVNGGFCSPIGVTPQNPGNNAALGTTATNCAVGVPRTGDIASYNKVQALRGPSNVPGGGAFFPRYPRYLSLAQNYRRSGGNLSAQWEPTDRTRLTVDGLYSKFDVKRYDDSLAALSFARAAANGGQPHTSIRNIEINSLGTVIYGEFDGVDARSESRIDKFTTEFAQLSVNFEHEFSDKLSISAFAGQNRSGYYSPYRTSVSVDRHNISYTYDARGGLTVPKITFGFDTLAADQYSYGARRSDGGDSGTWTDSTKDQYTDNANYEFAGKYQVNEYLKLESGLQYRTSDFNTSSTAPDPNQRNPVALPAGVKVADFTRQITGFEGLLGNPSIAGWVAANPFEWRKLTNFSRIGYCGIECGQSKSRVKEVVKTVYAMAKFDAGNLLPVPVRGDFGLRYVKTDQSSSGYIPVTNPAGSYYPTSGALATAGRSYDDLLPSGNLVIEVAPPLLFRLSAAKVMSRPELGNLIPNSTVSVVQRSGTVSNPDLDPIRAKTYDAAVEWYFKSGQLLSFAYFQKDISTYIQGITSLIPFNQLGLPLSLLANSNSPPDDLFVITRGANTPGGRLKGFELATQLRFDFLPGFLQYTGALASYTHVTSKIQYILSSANGVPVATTTANLIGLSENGLSGTLYYEHGPFSIRSTANYRDGYIREIPSFSNDSDITGQKPSTYVDASASYAINDQFKLLFEVQNMTDERIQLYTDSVRRDPLYETEVGRTFTVGITYRH